MNYMNSLEYRIDKIHDSKLRKLKSVGFIEIKLKKKDSMQNNGIFRS